VLLLVFRLGRDRYGLDASQIREVLPLVDIRPVPRAPQGVMGLFDFRGTSVPVVDLSLLVLGRPAARCLSTRLIVVWYPDSNGERRPLGIVAEKATSTVTRSRSDFADPGLSLGEARYLGPVARDGEGLLQLIEVGQLLPEPVRRVLFTQPAHDPCPSPGSNAF
jgi:chemotaxis-related protein WspB